MFKTLGIFGFIIVLLLIFVGVYFLLKWVHISVLQKRKGPLINTLVKIKDSLYKKLFYSSFLRYMIVSNLKLTYTVFGFFILTASKVFPVSESQETT